MAACASETRHDSADGNAGDVRDFLLGTSFELAQGDRFTEFGRQLFDGRAHGLLVLGKIERDAGIQWRVLCAVQFFIENDISFLGAAAFESGEGSVADDTQEPGAAVLAAKAFEKSKRAERRFLHNVFRVLVVSQKEPRQAVGCVEMRQNLPLEFAQARGLGQSEHG